MPGVGSAIGPLAGVRVLSLETFLAGNHATWLLGMLGAEIIKVEHGKGDVLRHVGAPIQGEAGVRHGGEMRVMGGKRSILLDMGKPGATDLFMQLVEKVDVVFANLKVSSLRKLGITFDTLRKSNPKIVYTTLSGFGHDDVVPSGPFGGWPAFDIIAQGLSGVQFRAEAEGDRPGYNGLAIGDEVTSTLSVLGTVSALFARDRTGEAQRVDVAMHDAMVFVNEQQIGIQSLLGTHGRRGRSSQSAPFGSFRTSDGWVNIAVGSDEIWQRYCKAIDDPALGADPRFEKSSDRVAQLVELDEIVERWTRQHTTQEVIDALLKHTVPSAPVFDIPEVVESPQVAARNMLVEIDDPLVGPRRIVGNPIKMTGVDDTYLAPPPLLGADTGAVMSELLQMSESEFQSYVKEGVLGEVQDREDEAQSMKLS